jgi:hypothetical protein
MYELGDQASGDEQRIEPPITATRGGRAPPERFVHARRTARERGGLQSA